VTHVRDMRGRARAVQARIRVAREWLGPRGGLMGSADRLLKRWQGCLDQVPRVGLKAGGAQRLRDVREKMGEAEEEGKRGILSTWIVRKTSEKENRPIANRTTTWARLLRSSMTSVISWATIGSHSGAR